MKSFDSLPQSQDLFDLTVKIDRLLRLFKISKKTDQKTRSDVETQIKKLKDQMKSINSEQFQKIEEKLTRFINSALSQLEVKVKKDKIPSSSDLPSFQSSWTSKKMTEKKIPSSNSSFRIQKNQDSSEFSDMNSKKGESNLKHFCAQHFDNLQSKIYINEDVIAHLKTMKPQNVALLGVQKPQDFQKDRLFLSTVMQFEKNEVISLKMKTNNFVNEIQQFTNVLRYPLVLAIIGRAINDMKIHFGKFLLQMGSPAPIVIIFNQTSTNDSIVISLKEKSIDELNMISMFQIEKADQKFIKDKSLYRSSLMSVININKEKNVATKILKREFQKQVIQNKQAIKIQKNQSPIKKKNPMFDVKPMASFTPQPIQMKEEKKQEQKPSQPSQAKKENKIISQKPKTNNSEVEQQKKQSIKSESNKTQKKETIKSQSTQFRFKVHQKFIGASPKQDFYLYQINENNQLFCRKKLNSLSDGAAYIKSTDSECILSFTVRKDDKEIPVENVQNLYSCHQKSPLFCIRLKSLTSHKVAFFTFKQGIREEDLKKPIIFKSIQGNTNQLTNLVMMISKANISQYESKVQVQEI